MMKVWTRTCPLARSRGRQAQRMLVGTAGRNSRHPRIAQRQIRCNTDIYEARTPRRACRVAGHASRAICLPALTPSSAAVEAMKPRMHESMAVGVMVVQNCGQNGPYVSVPAWRLR